MSWVRRVLRAVRIAARDPRIPRPLRWLAGLGLLPVPGPFDEVLLLLVAVPLLLFYRGPLADAWRRAAEPACAPSDGLVESRSESSDTKEP